jgi:tetratricopeptide (TPR) repeat protein
MKRSVASLLLVAGLILPSCAPKPALPIPEGEDYVYPAPAAGEVSARERNDLEKAWRRVLAGDQRAVRDYQKILSKRPDLLAARTGLAYARLRGDQIGAAAAAFEAVLGERPDDVPALVGAGSTAFRGEDLDGALALYRRALEAAPSDPVVRTRTARLKLQITERHMASAEAARGAGDEETAVREYQAALDVAPELAGMRLTLAELLLAQDEETKAVATLRADPTGDRQVLLRLGAVLQGQGRFEEARAVFRDMLIRDPSDLEARRGERVAQEALDFQSQPEQYRRIREASRALRADLAALLAVKVSALRRLPPSEPRLAVDISSSWAREHIATILRLGIMDVYPNHTFQPRATVRRGDLARASSRVLRRLGWRRGRGAAPADMRPSHLDHDAVVTVVAAGLMHYKAGGAFEPWRPVTGREAVDVVDALARLVGP